MAAKKSNKRKARESDMQHAADLVRRYRTQEPFRNAFSEVEGFVTGDYLAECLEVFAKFGTWETPIAKVYIGFGPEYELRPYTEWFAAEKRDKLRAMFRGYRAAGFGAEEAKNEIIKAVAKFGVDLSGEDWHNLLYRKKL